MKLKIVKSKGMAKGIVLMTLTSDMLYIHVNPDAVEVIEA
ncbi:unnamed protein product [marine sediment metagenome]|uniref:Uncharacterized protein n=1 Tax=marine sediment metagenome TaxID=412755 RepID=X1UQF0_9ZZZZ